MKFIVIAYKKNNGKKFKHMYLILRNVLAEIIDHIEF